MASFTLRHKILSDAQLPNVNLICFWHMVHWYLLFLFIHSVFCGRIIKNEQEKMAIKFLHSYAIYQYTSMYHETILWIFLVKSWDWRDWDWLEAGNSHVMTYDVIKPNKVSTLFIPNIPQKAQWYSVLMWKIIFSNLQSI